LSWRNEVERLSESFASNNQNNDVGRETIQNLPIYTQRRSRNRLELLVLGRKCYGKLVENWSGAHAESGWQERKSCRILATIHSKHPKIL
jgi:hypothetical protein